MAVWLVRAGKHGEYEQKFIQDKRVFVTWDGFTENLASVSGRKEVQQLLSNHYPEAPAKRLSNWASQIWPFVSVMQIGDLVILPLKSQSAIQIGEITSDYQFHPNGPDPYFHSRKVKWIGEAIPRSNFGQDILYSLGAFMTICRVRRNKAEARIAAMRANGWGLDPNLSSNSAGILTDSDGDADANMANADIEEISQDQISQAILAKFKGHGLTRLVEAILKAQGYQTYRSPEGADGGADILAGAGPLGFGAPRLCVEVKSGAAPIDRSTVDKLLGAVGKFGAQEGLFVSWGGFKSTVAKEMASSFFKVRLWTQKELLEALFSSYDRLDPEIRAELPLKQIWTVAAQDS